ncbi:hypothetical protein BN961_00281 [Afipia felis]|uniref:Uncharacterized protein n=1 Tax=Afipia felis TaxID=1035 RepID=A0A090N6I3_AFIFE|nr:hypothetical protein BN961_00281 [Afipia felis]
MGRAPPGFDSAGPSDLPAGTCGVSEFGAVACAISLRPDNCDHDNPTTVSPIATMTAASTRSSLNGFFCCESMTASFHAKDNGYIAAKVPPYGNRKQG